MPFLLGFLKAGVMRFLPVFLAFFSFGNLKKYARYLPYLGGAVLLYILYKFFQSEKTLSEVDEETNPDSKKAYALAVLLTDYLGTHKNSSWWNPTNWYEQENMAVAVLTDYKHLISLIENQYSQLSKSGSLKSDLERLIDADTKVKLFRKLWGI